MLTATLMDRRTAMMQFACCGSWCISSTRCRNSKPLQIFMTTKATPILEWLFCLDSFNNIYRSESCPLSGRSFAMPPVAGMVFTRYFFSAMHSSSFSTRASQTRCFAFNVTTCTPCVSRVDFAEISTVSASTARLPSVRKRRSRIPRRLEFAEFVPVANGRCKLLQLLTVGFRCVGRHRYTGRLSVGKYKEQITLVICGGNHLHHEFPVSKSQFCRNVIAHDAGFGFRKVAGSGFVTCCWLVKNSSSMQLVVSR